MKCLTRLGAATGFLALAALPASAGVRDETICGWIEMEGQYYVALKDAYDTYVLSNDSGSIDGIETVRIDNRGPGWNDREAREARYCGCMGGTFNGAELIHIYDFRQKEVSACINDPKLPRH